LAAIEQVCSTASYNGFPVPHKRYWRHKICKVYVVPGGEKWLMLLWLLVRLGGCRRAPSDSN